MTTETCSNCIYGLECPSYNEVLLFCTETSCLLVVISSIVRNLFFGTSIHAWLCGLWEEVRTDGQVPQPSRCEAPALITAPQCCIFATWGILEEAGILVRLPASEASVK